MLSESIFSQSICYECLVKWFVSFLSEVLEFLIYAHAIVYAAQMILCDTVRKVNAV